MNFLTAKIPTVAVDQNSRIVTQMEVPASTVRIGDLMVGYNAVGFEQLVKVSEVDITSASNLRVSTVTADGATWAGHRYAFDRKATFKVVSKVLIVTADGHIVTAYDRPGV